MQQAPKRPPLLGEGNQTNNKEKEDNNVVSRTLSPSKNYSLFQKKKIDTKQNDVVVRNVLILKVGLLVQAVAPLSS